VHPGGVLGEKQVAVGGLQLGRRSAVQPLDDLLAVFDDFLAFQYRFLLISRLNLF